MDQINQQDLKSHDRRPPHRPSSNQNTRDNSQNKLPQQNLSKTLTKKLPSQKRDDSQNKKMKIQSYVKTTKQRESISTDISNSTRASYKQPSSKTLTGTQQFKRGNSIEKSNKTKTNKKCTHDKPKKKKKNKLQERIARQKQLDLEEQLRREEEELRQNQLLEFRLEQERILTEEEKQRLMGQYQSEEEFLLKFENQIFNNKQNRQKYDEWADYLDCRSRPNPEKENTMTQFLYIYGEKQQVEGFQKIQKILEGCDYSEEVVNDLQSCYLKAQADNNIHKMKYYQSFIDKIQTITERKIMEITAYIMKNQKELVEEQNIKIEKEGQELLSGNNIKKICAQVQQKQELRSLYEIQREYVSDYFKFGIWINPLTRCGYRSRPIEFQKIGSGMEVPRTYNDQLVMTCVQYDQDIFSKQVGQEYDCAGGVVDFKLYKFLPLPMVRQGFSMQRSYDSIEEACYQLHHPQYGFQGTIQELSGWIPIPEECNVDIEGVQLGYYCDRKKQWCLDKDQLFIKKVDLINKKIHFSTQFLKPFAILQKRQNIFPYKSWFLRQNSDNSCLLDIETEKGKFVFEFGSQFVKLRRCNSINCLEDLFDQEMDGAKLLLILKSLGFNFLPQDQDFIGAEYQEYKKHSDVENKALQEIIFSLPSFSIKSEPRINENEFNKVYFQVRENLEYNAKDFESDEVQWKKVGVWYNKCGFLSYKNQQELLQGTQTHASIQIILKNHQETCKGDVLSKIENMLYPELQNNVRRFLKFTKLVSFT